jgi:hypothetical protein
MKGGLFGIFFWIFNCFAKKVDFIPTGNDYPPGSVFSCAGFDEKMDRVVVFGGSNIEGSLVYSSFQGVRVLGC